MASNYLKMGDMLLPHLMEGDCSTHICVRVARFWELYNPQNETQLLHTDMVLVDEEGNAMHAQVYPAHSEMFKQMVKEGKVYNFCYFRVKKSGSYKPVPNDLMATFSKWTTVEEVAEIPPAFPEHAYTLASMEQIQSRVDSIAEFTDVIGVITSISNVDAIQTRMKQGETMRRTVVIREPSGTLLKVVLWGERATSFPAEETHRNSQSCPQIVIFVGTLVKSYGGMSLTGSSSCKWYINPQVQEVKKLMASAKAVHQPINWTEDTVPPQIKKSAQEKKISDIKNLNPFQCKKDEFLVTVTIKKIDKSWCYIACKKCIKTAKRSGDSYKCTNPSCGAVGMPTQRYKLAILAGDETGDTNFIVFGRIAQRLIKKAADSLIADNPVGFIPNEITKLLERTYIWNVSFTDSTIESGNITFQVNAVVAEINDGSAVIPATPAGSQTSSLMLSRGASPSVQDTPHSINLLPLSQMPNASETSLASSATPSKMSVPATELMDTPQGGKDAAGDEADTLTSAAALPVLPDKSSAKKQVAPSKKRSRQSPNKKVAKELFGGEQPGDDTADDGFVVPAAARNRPRPSPNKKVAKGLSAEEQAGESGDDSGGKATTAVEDSPSTAA